MKCCSKSWFFYWVCETKLIFLSISPFFFEFLVQTCNISLQGLLIYFWNILFLGNNEFWSLNSFRVCFSLFFIQIVTIFSYSQYWKEWDFLEFSLFWLSNGFKLFSLLKVNYDFFNIIPTAYEKLQAILFRKLQNFKQNIMTPTFWNACPC